MQKKYKNNGFVVVGINSNESENYSEDSYDNMVKTAGGLISQSQQLEIARAQAQQYPTGLPQFFTPSGGGLGMFGWTAILGMAGIGISEQMRVASCKWRINLIR